MISLRVPGSKSLTNRALLAAALGNGKSTLKNILESDDTRHMMRALQHFGVRFTKRISNKGNVLSITGGSTRWQTSRAAIFCGNSGTTIRFLASVLAASDFPSTLTGEKRMKERPIADLAGTLTQLGANVEWLGKEGFPPLRVQGPLKGGRCTMKGNVSSQFVSGLLLAAPLAERPIHIRVLGELVSKPYVDMTIAVMKAFGVQVKRKGYREFSISPQPYRTTTMAIEGDASSASYFWGLGALTAAAVNLTNVPMNSLQADVIPVKLGIYKQLLHRAHDGQTININATDFPDSAMTLAVLSAFRKGKTRLSGLANLRVKECDRLQALLEGLAAIGCPTKIGADFLEVHGNPEKLHGGKIKTYGDHRMAMCFGMASILLPGMLIDDQRCVKKTYPKFWRDLRSIQKKLNERNIVLTGMRGSGKSKLGKLLAARLRRRFVDLDTLIEKKSGMEIKAIVARHGWPHFRKLEEQASQALSTSKKLIIATGGGTLMLEKNALALKAHGAVIWLNCPIPLLKKRLSKSSHRPSLTKKHVLEEVEVIYRQRKKIYKKVADRVTMIAPAKPEKNLKRLLQSVAQLGFMVS